MSRKNTILLKRINNFLKSDDNHNFCTRNAYTRPVFNKTKNIYKFAFSTISIQTLNFLDNKFSEHNSSLVKRKKKQIREAVIQGGIRRESAVCG